MKKHYTLLLATALALFSSGCSKDIFKRYEKRLQGGTWQLENIHSSGFGSWDKFAFSNGSFTFLPAGRLEYIDLDGNFYEGSWNLDKQYDPNSEMDVHTLQIYVVNFQTQRVLSEYYDAINFTGTDRFVGIIYTNNRTYRFVFKR